ncbi:ribosome biogenesis GTPase YlqF [Eubacterium sp.]
MPELIKQNVQWFPGHMAKTRRLIKESLNLVDGVVELLDARVPYSSQNPELDGIIKNKPRIILLNKCDVANPTATAMWIKYFESKGAYAIPVDCKTGKGLNKFDDTVKKALANVIAKNEEKGMTGKPLRLMVVGIPNTGKSSFINRMGKNAKAKVADKAGVTKQNQWFVVGNGIELLDTPGVLWPKFDDPEVGDKLAFIGSVKDEVTDKETIACRLLESLAKTNPNAIEERYKISGVEGLQGWEILEMIGKKRGFLIKGGEIDYERAAVIVADEFRGGKLGRITLELP